MLGALNSLLQAGACVWGLRSEAHEAGLQAGPGRAEWDRKLLVAPVLSC